MALTVPFLSSGPKATSGSRKPIEQFVSTVKQGALARTNRFAVQMATPKGMTEVNLSAFQNVLLFCDSAQLPGANFSTTQNRTFGEFREVPYEKLYDQVSMTFYVDNKMSVKEFFDDWQNVIYNPATRTFGYYKDYVTDLTVLVQDINDNTCYAVTLFECYPKTISNIQLDAASKDVMKVTVGFQYKYWGASTVSPMANGDQINNGILDKFKSNFNKFQSALNGILGDRLGNAITGSAVSYGVTKLPGLLGRLKF